MTDELKANREFIEGFLQKYSEISSEEDLLQVLAMETKNSEILQKNVQGWGIDFTVMRAYLRIEVDKIYKKLCENLCDDNELQKSLDNEIDEPGRLAVFVNIISEVMEETLPDLLGNGTLEVASIVAAIILVRKGKGLAVEKAKDFCECAAAS